MTVIEIQSSLREEIIDITDRVRQVARDEGWTSGAVHLFCQHTTCGLTINEGADPAVKADLLKFFRGIAPMDGATRRATATLISAQACWASPFSSPSLGGVSPWEHGSIFIFTKAMAPETGAFSFNY